MIDAPAITGSYTFTDERWTEEAVKGWVGAPFMFDDRRIGTITKAWVSEDGRTVWFEATTDDLP